MHGKIRFWSGEGQGSWCEVSVRQIEIADDRFTRVEKFACNYGTVE